MATVAGNLGGVPFGGYVAQAQIQIQAAQNETIANINRFKALIPSPTAGVSAPHTDFDEIHPETARKLRAELDALIVVIDASPIA